MPMPMPMPVARLLAAMMARFWPGYSSPVQAIHETL
jgi:hypothetical protein